MSLEENKAIIRSLVEIFNKHSLAFDDLIAPDVIIDPTLRGIESFKQFETNVIKAFPDYSETIEDIIAEGDKVWIRFRFIGTHTGEWNLLDLFGIKLAPTGKKVTYTGVGIWRTREQARGADLGEDAQTINEQGVTIVPLNVTIDNEGEVHIRAIDPDYANPGPDEVQKF